MTTTMGDWDRLVDFSAQVLRPFAESFFIFNRPYFYTNRPSPTLPFPTSLHPALNFFNKFALFYRMTPSAKDIVNSQLANFGPNPDARSVTPEQRTSSGVVPEHALYDSPEEGSQPAEFRSGRRQRRSTERGGRWIETVTRSAGIRKKGNRTRKINSARRAHVQGYSTEEASASQGPTLTQPTSQSKPIPEPQPNPHSQPNPNSQPKPGPLPKSKRRGRSRTVRDISRSPTPGSTDHSREREAPTQPATNSPRITYVYETLDLAGLIRYARDKFAIDGRDCNTQTLLAKLRVAETQQATQVGPPRQPPTIQTLPGVPLQVGGGWHRDFVASQPNGARGTKRGPGASDAPSASTKRQRINQAPKDDTAAMSETEDERPGRPATDPPLSRQSTATTISAAQPPRSLAGSPSRSQYGKSVTPTNPVPRLPTLLSPTRGPVHARLRRKALQRYIDRVDQDIEAADAAGTDEEIDQLAPTDNEELPEKGSRLLSGIRQGAPQDASTGPSAPGLVPQRTYGGTRTHVHPQPQAGPSGRRREPESSPEPEPEPEPEELDPNSPRTTTAKLILKERARALAAKVQEEVQGVLTQRQRRLFAEATEPPATRPQLRPPPVTNSGSSGSRVRGDRGTRRVDPVGAARSDMTDFNEACAQGQATSFVQSATRPSARERERERTARSTIPRPLTGYLDDDEESLAAAEALAKNKWPPLARDVSGLERQILILAKIHLFAYALVQGIYQTRATFLLWAEAVYFATWQMELPTTAYEKPPMEYLEIMVNSIATMRGKVKERIRPFAATAAGFEQRPANQEVIQENLRRYHLIHPNSFHCESYCPRKGHFENPEVAHCIAIALFHGPGSVGLMYPDYFTEMPLTVVAFALAIWQFGIEEWSKGWQQNGDLGMAAMCEKYESILAGLKQLRDVAPRRMSRLQTEWRDFVAEYSGAMLSREGVDTNGPRQSEMRPDTPDLEEEDQAQAQVQTTNAMSVDEMNNRLFETARLASLEERARQIAARELENGLDAPIDEDQDDDAAPHAPTARSRSGTPPPPEYDEEGRLTTRSKGKRRAN